MLSILIPIYNFDIRPFVGELHRQATILKIDFEIILADDCSAVEFQNLNKTLSDLSAVQYIQLNQNIGRSKIRNFLVSKSRFEKLLFADCDSEIVSSDFLKLYIDACEKAEIVCGGRAYRKSDSEKPESVLRVKYGMARESVAATQRNRFPNRSFMTNNFLISKSVFSQIKFDENLTRYGHEDTLFGCELARKDKKILHIDNPLFHIGLETADEFLEKTRRGLANLKYITQNYDYPELHNDIKLLKITEKTRLLKPLYKLTFRISKKIFEQNLKSKKPNLLVFDLYKLGFYSSLKQQELVPKTL
jgi:glycosyltransferase involved in cell wall biosynthesis